MEDHIYWIFELTVKEGQLHELKKVMRDMVATTEVREPGTLGYHWTLSADAPSHLVRRVR